MSRMVRKQFYITSEQDEKLKRLAAEQGLTEAEVVRRALEELGVSYVLKAAHAAGRIGEAVMDRYIADERESGISAAARLRRQLDAHVWQEELAFMRSIGKDKQGDAAGGTWRFNRDELYEDREAKILRRH